MKVLPFHAINWTRGALGLVLLSLLTGCASFPSWGAWSQRPTEAQIAAAMSQPEPAKLQTFAAQQR